jgi:exosome complex component RRP42
LKVLKNVIIVFVDVYVLNHDGNLIDASSMAALAAILNTKMPNYVLEEGEVKKKTGYVQLPIKNYPIAITFAKINGKMVVDPGLEEEQVMDARLTMIFDKDGDICAIQKGGGSGSFTAQQIVEVAKIGQQKSAELRKLLVKE